MKLLFLALALDAVACAPSEDAVPSLPSYGTPPSAQFSGFLNASAAEDGTFLHYWYAAYEGEASASAEDTPVILWMNGGPGSSSVLGFLEEHGPLLVNASGGLMQNPYAWTKLGHLVALESPAGVGYSYCKASTTGGSCHNTDKSTAAAARAAMQDFFKSKFPELAKNPFYVTGESYAGVYVPTLTKEILDNAPEINIQGLAVGDPCTDNEAQRDSMDMLWYGHKYGFVPDEEFDFLWNNCSSRAPSAHRLGRFGANVKRNDIIRMVRADGTRVTASSECDLAERKFLLSTSKAFSQVWENAWINDLTLYGPAALVSWGSKGSLNAMTAEYMNRDDVKAALHVKDAPTKQWPGPDDGWTYTSQYAACNDNAPPGTPSMVDFYKDIVPRLKTTVVFNGDTDPCVSYEGTRAAMIKVGLKEVVGGQYRPWFFNATATTPELLAEKPLLFGPSLALQEGGSQFGGHVVDYEQSLHFVTVHGSGHMVPQFRPRAAIHMLEKVLFHDAALSPLTESDSALKDMSNDDYSKYLDNWTITAKQAPYVGQRY